MNKIYQNLIEVGDYLYVHIMKLKEDDEIAFPISSIKNIEKVPFKKTDEDSQVIRIKIIFIDELKLNDIYIWFLSEKLYITFLEIFLESSLKKEKKNSNNGKKNNLNF